MDLLSPARCPDEDSLLAFVEGRLPAPERTATTAHLERCPSCQEIVTAIAPALLSGTTPAVGLFPRPTETGPLVRGATIGRYVVLSLIGRGGMGEVYAAYDPELDRKVALKLLHEGDQQEGGDVARARLLREAKAIAKLSHPNVVVVHDAGTIDDRVFIAMEFVDGVTLAEWLKLAPRTSREVLAVFVDAGRALSAAHAVGLVHRDFKPQNVMVGEDGKVRVMDFGLAAHAGPADDAPADGPAQGDVAPGRFDATATGALTRTGALLGTPAYMAPEQYLGEVADARTDQFSFCVSLYQGLFGERPFKGDSLAALATGVLSGRVPEPAQRGRVAPWLRRVVLRGLEVKRERRYPSMDALLAELDKDPARRRKQIGAVGAALLVVIGLLGVAHRMGEGRRAICMGASARFEGIWEAPTSAGARRETIRRAFAGSGQLDAEPTFDRAARLLDAYVARWTSMYTDACQATHERGEQSSEVLDLRMDCLNERLGNVRALTDVFASADAKIVQNAISAAAALPGLDRCADVAQLRAVIQPPDDAATRRRVEALRTELAKLVALRDSGQCALGIRRAETLIPEVRATGYQPLLAQALLAAGALGMDCGDPNVMVERFQEAHIAANASRYDEIAAEASSSIVVYVINRLEDPTLARVWLTVARGDGARLRRETDATAVLAEAESWAAVMDRQYDRGLQHNDRAHEILRRIRGVDDPWTLITELNRGEFLSRAGRLEEALKATSETIGHFERVFGPRHPQTAVVVNNLGEVLNHLGRPGEAEAAYQRALDIWRANGADPMMLAWALTGLGRARIGQGKPELALAPLEEAFATREGQHAAPTQLGETRFNVARALWSRPADRKRALDLATAARAEVRAEPKAVAEIDAWLAQARRQTDLK